MARRVSADIAALRHLDAYVVSALALVFAVVTVLSDAISVDLRWAVALAGLGVLVYRTTAPKPDVTIDQLLQDRQGFEAAPAAARLRKAREVWLFAPTGINFLSEENLAALRAGPMSRPDGSLRVMVLDPANEAAMTLAVRQLDDSITYPLQEFGACHRQVVQRLEAIANTWPKTGTFEYRYLDYNPGFSLVAIDPTGKQGRVIVEFHGFRNEATSSRMHFELGTSDSRRWFLYWTNQFEQMWAAARSPD
ncbi:hypothetical protein [Cryptosporangium arvum]|uniref:hypothetical protein n=1 Tax=Cryptosporangium arvum TaxID=80871 RepID=UPI00056C05EB|nr:hypothetical protein [Cryptosporangium arvum]